MRRGSMAAMSRSWVMTHDRRAVRGVQLAQQLEDRRAGRACRGCRSARRRGRAPGGRPGPGRSRPAGARHRTAAPGRWVSRCPSPTRSSAARGGPPRSLRPDAAVEQPVGDVVERGLAAEQEELLEHEADPPGPQRRTAAGRTAPATSCPAIRTVPSVGRSSVPRGGAAWTCPSRTVRRSRPARPPRSRRSTPRSASTGGAPGYCLPTPGSSTTALTTAPRRCRPPRGPSARDLDPAVLEQPGLDPDERASSRRSATLRRRSRPRGARAAR